MAVAVAVVALLFVVAVEVRAAAVIAQVDVFTAGNGSHACYRVPTVVTTSTGTTVVMVEARRTACDDQAPKDVEMRRSVDGGLTWTSPVTVAGSLVGNTTFRNPYLTVTRRLGSTADVLLLQYVDSTFAEPWITWQTYSMDDGASWSQASQVPAITTLDAWMALALMAVGLQVDLGVWNGTLAGPGYGLQLSTSSPAPGRIVMCGATGYHTGHAMNTVVWYSDDMGGSYLVSGTVFRNFQECQMVELPGGRLLMNMRNSHLTSCDCRAQATSDDGGVSWSPVFFAPDLVEPVCSAGLLQLSSGPLLFSNPHSASERVNMTLMASHDDGQSWQPALGVWPGPSAYSVLTALPNQRVGLVYERGLSSPYEHVTLGILDVASA